MKDPAKQRPPVVRMPPLLLEVVGLAGPLCTLESDPSWSIRQVKDELQARIGWPSSQQQVLLGTTRLADDVFLQVAASLHSAPAPPAGDLQRLTLTLIRLQEVPSLRKSIRLRDEEAALALLENPRVDLLEIDNEGHTVLHSAIARYLPQVAFGILRREDFKALHASSISGRTALHVAASLGCLEICRAITRHPDFNYELLSRVDRDGKTARALAALGGHEEVMYFLADAEARGPRKWHFQAPPVNWWASFKSWHWF